MGLVTGGSGHGFRSDNMKKGESVEMCVAPQGTFSTLRGVKVTDGSLETFEYKCQATDVASQARKYTHTATKAGSVTVLSDQAVIIFKVVVGKETATGINSSLAETTEIRINGETISAENAVRIEVYSMTGACVKAVNGRNMDIDTLNKGAYICKVTLSDGSSATRKFMK